MAQSQRIARPIAAALVSLSLALPVPGAAQERTEREEASDSQRNTRNLLLGLAALAAIGFAIKERRDDEEEEEERARRLPARCLGESSTPEGVLALYDPDCLDEHFGASARLPLECAVTVRTREGFYSGFEPECLGEKGWGVERN